VYTGFWWVNLKGTVNVEVSDVDGRIIFIWNFRKWDVVYGLDCSSLGQVVDTCECGNEPSGSIKCGEFLD